MPPENPKRILIDTMSHISGRAAPMGSRTGASRCTSATSHASCFVLTEYAAKTSERLRKTSIAYRRHFRFVNADFRHDNFAGYKAIRADVPTI